MTQAVRTGILWGALLVAVAVAGTLLLRRQSGPGPSVLSASPQGWLAARTYLERRGSHVTLLDRPEEPAATGALVVSFPWQRPASVESLDALRRRLAAGGTVVYAYSGGRRGSFEDDVAEALGLSLDSVRDPAPLSPGAWYRYATAVWTLKPADGAAADAVAVIGAPDRVPKAPSGAQVLLVGEKNTPAVFSYTRARGRVIVVPVDAFSNARLGQSGNGNLLESIRSAVGDDVVFDEYHHGLVSREALAATGDAKSLDLLLLQLALLYVFCAWALARRFGPAWEEPPEIASSTTNFLLGLGALHRKLGHSGPACLRLLDAAEALDPRIRIPTEVRRRAHDTSEEAFLQTSRIVARLQRRGR